MDQSSGINRTLQFAGITAAVLLVLLTAASMGIAARLRHWFEMPVGGALGAEVKFFWIAAVLVAGLAGMALASFYTQGTWNEARFAAGGERASRFSLYTCFSLALAACLALGHQLPRVILTTNILGIYSLETFFYQSSAGGLLFGLGMFLLSLVFAGGIVALWFYLARQRPRQRFQRALDH
jgi:hypothetical protein